jgi:hypothetical protein
MEADLGIVNAYFRLGIYWDRSINEICGRGLTVKNWACECKQSFSHKNSGGYWSGNSKTLS